MAKLPVRWASSGTRPAILITWISCPNDTSVERYEYEQAQENIWTDGIGTEDGLPVAHQRQIIAEDSYPNERDERGWCLWRCAVAREPNYIWAGFWRNASKNARDDAVEARWAQGSPFPASKHDLPYRLLQALSFSSMAEEALSKLNIKLGGSLKLKTDYKVRVAATEELGMTEHWSSEGLYRHLRVLQKLVPRAVSVCEI